MAKIYNITDKMSEEKPVIVWGDNEYEVNDDFDTVVKLREMEGRDPEDMIEVINLALGENNGINLRKLKISNLQVLLTVIMAAVQNIEYEEAERRFQIKNQ